jgi:hypothetical protein
MLITNTGLIGINNQNPQSTLDVGGSLSALSFSSNVKSFVIPHETKQGWKLRHYCTESDVRGGAVQYTRQITSLKAGVTDLIMPDWFAWLAKNVTVFCNGFRHHGTAWGEQDSLDPCVLHINCSRGGVYNVLICAHRADLCATTMCSPDVEFLPEPPAVSADNFPA